MCGIVGYIGTREAPEICLAGLRRLEYRGYDSAGIAVVNGKNLDRHKLDNMAEALAGNGISGTVGIGHARPAVAGKFPPALQRRCSHRRGAQWHSGKLSGTARGAQGRHRNDGARGGLDLGIKQARGRAQSIELLLKAGIGMAQFVHQRRSETDEGANVKRHPLALTDCGLTTLADCLSA